jgi:hypothetical protein
MNSEELHPKRLMFRELGDETLPLTWLTTRIYVK